MTDTDIEDVPGRHFELLKEGVSVTSVDVIGLPSGFQRLLQALKRKYVESVPEVYCGWSSK